MNKKFLITHTMLKKAAGGPVRRFLVCALYEDGKMAEVSLQPAGTESILHNMYTARVQNVAAGLHAAFVEISAGQRCFLPLDDSKHPIFVKKTSQKPIAAGDELVVQICKEAYHTKEAVATTNLSFSGEYLILTSANRKIGVSSKLPSIQKKRLQALAEKLRGNDTHYGLILRTNAAAADEERIQAEFLRLKSEYERLAAYAATRTAGSCLRREQPLYRRMLMDTDKAGLTEIITDEQAVYDDLRQDPLTDAAVRLYADNLLPLASLYSVSSQLEDACKPRVWLKSGANIIIQPTEALTVIDVNSSKHVVKKEKQPYHYQINREAAAEIARQLRLRNISGIIIVDFIDLYDDEQNASLLKEFRSQLKKDPVPVQLMGMTRLGLMELTRKKLKKPLLEQLTSAFCT